MQIILLLKSLSALPCFNNVSCVTAITGGLSNPCFKVKADDAIYFAKFTREQALGNELKIASIAELNGITPSVYYHDNQWLISTYIEGENLAVQTIPLKNKIMTSIELMNQFHQLFSSLLNPNDYD